MKTYTTTLDLLFSSEHETSACFAALKQPSPSVFFFLEDSLIRNLGTQRTKQLA